MRRKWLVIGAASSLVFFGEVYVALHYGELYDRWDAWRFRRWENDYQGGFRDGQDSAREDIKAGRLRFADSGLIFLGTTYTNTPFMITGCVVTRHSEGFDDGYNAEVTKRWKPTASQKDAKK